MLASGSYEAAILGFKASDNYKDASERINEVKYLWAQNTNIDEAMTLFGELGNYKDAEEKLAALKKQKMAEIALKKIESAYAMKPIACSQTKECLSFRETTKLKY